MSRVGQRLRSCTRWGTRASPQRADHRHLQSLTSSVPITDHSGAPETVAARPVNYAGPRCWVTGVNPSKRLDESKIIDLEASLPLTLAPVTYHQDAPGSARLLSWSP